MHACIPQQQEYISLNLKTKLGIWSRKNALPKKSHQQKGTDFAARRSDVVSCQSKSSPNNLARAEPRVQLDAEECCDTSVLDFQIISVLPQLLHLIKLFPECFRKAARTMSVQRYN